MDRSAQQGPVKRTPFVSGSCRAFKMLLCLKMFKTFSTANFALPGWPKAGGTLWFIKWLNIGCFVLFQCPCTTSRTAQFKYIRLAAKSGFIVSRLVSDCCTELRFVNSEPGGRRSRVTLAESGGLTHSDHVHVWLSGSVAPLGGPTGGTRSTRQPEGLQWSGPTGGAPSC